MLRQRAGRFENRPEHPANLLPLARVLLFLIATAVILAATAPVARSFSGKDAELFLGGVTSIATFALTLLFVRWERLRLTDVGAKVNAGSLVRLALGLLIGAVIITTWAAISLAAGQVHWVARTMSMLVRSRSHFLRICPWHAARNWRFEVIRSA